MARTSDLSSPMPNATVATTTCTSPDINCLCTRRLCAAVMPAWYDSTSHAGGSPPAFRLVLEFQTAKPCQARLAVSIPSTYTLTTPLEQTLTLNQTQWRFSQYAGGRGGGRMVRSHTMQRSYLARGVTHWHLWMMPRRSLTAGAQLCLHCCTQIVIPCRK